MDDLRKCPFCNGKPHYARKRAVFHGVNGYGEKKVTVRTYVYCGRCKARGGVFTKVCIIGADNNYSFDDSLDLNQGAADKWNCRPIKISDVVREILEKEN